MKFDFTTVLDRAGKDARAIDELGFGGPYAPDRPKEGFDPIPMWVADMNYPTCPSILKAMSDRLTHPCFGYFMPSRAYLDAIIRWHAVRKGVTDLTDEVIGYENGVLGGVSCALQAFSAPGEPVLLHSPTYVGFTGTIENCGRRAVHSPLVQDAQGVWRMDLQDMEQKIVENKLHLAIFCNPHNPSGRVWTREEVSAVMELFRKYDVTVISDEIWSDIILPGNHHTPTQSVSEDAKNRTIALYAPSKTFNLAGLVGSYHVIYNPCLRDRMARQSAISHYNEMNVMSMHGLIGAFSDEGMAWADELCQVLDRNLRYVKDYVEAHFPGVHTTLPQGTYIMMLDCQEWCEAHGKTLSQLLKAAWDVGVDWQDGRPFFCPWGVRVNAALPYSRVQEAMDRLSKYVFND